jgi:hypothetical protein
MSITLLHETYKTDFEELFADWESKPEPVVSFSKFNSFISNWTGYFKENDIRVNSFLLNGIFFLWESE